MRRRWQRWEFVDRLGIVVTASTVVALVGLSMCAACNSDDGRSPADRLVDNPAVPTLPPIDCPAGVDGPQFACYLQSSTTLAP